MLSTELLCPPDQYAASGCVCWCVQFRSNCYVCVCVCMWLVEGSAKFSTTNYTVSTVITVEPPNKGHFVDNTKLAVLSFAERLSSVTVYRDF